MGAVLRCRAVLGLRKRNFDHLLARGWDIYNGLAGNPTLFVDPNPSLQVLLARNQGLDAAQQAAHAHLGPVATATRNAKAAELITALETARAYVQELADDTTPAQASTLIVAAGMSIARVSAYAKPFLLATQRKPSDAVHLAANVNALTADTVGAVFFNWQYSGDGGATWLDAPSTPRGRTDLADLTPRHTYGFRVSVTDVRGPRAWSQAGPSWSSEAPSGAERPTPPLLRARCRHLALP